MSTAVEPPRLREDSKQRLVSEKEEVRAREVQEAYERPQKPWPARHKFLTGLGVLVIAGGVGIGIGTQMAGETSVTPAGSSAEQPSVVIGSGAGSANSAEHQSVVIGSGAGSANSAEHQSIGSGAGSANSAEHR